MRLRCSLLPPSLSLSAPPLAPDASIGSLPSPYPLVARGLSLSLSLITFGFLSHLTSCFPVSCVCLCVCRGGVSSGTRHFPTPTTPYEYYWLELGSLHLPSSLSLPRYPGVPPPQLPLTLPLPLPLCVSCCVSELLFLVLLRYPPPPPRGGKSPITCHPSSPPKALCLVSCLVIASPPPPPASAARRLPPLRRRRRHRDAQ